MMDNNGWISVDDRLPDKIDDCYREDVLILVQYGSIDGISDDRVICAGKQEVESGTWWAYMAHGCETIGGDDKNFEDEKKDRVTHWMPLPKMPQKSEKERLIKIENRLIDLVGQLDHVSNQLDEITGEMSDIKDAMEV